MIPDSLTDALRETLGAFDEGSPMTTAEVADQFDIGRRSTYERLSRLVDKGALKTKKVGANGRVWWRSTPVPIAESTIRSGQCLDENATQFELLVDAVEEYAIFMLDPAGQVQTWNRGARNIHGFRADAILGEHISAFYTTEDCAAGVPERNLSRAALEGSVDADGWRVRANGSRFWASVTITALFDEDGELEGYVTITKDTTESRIYEQDLRRERDHLDSELRDVFDRVDDAIAALDHDWRFTYVNEHAVELLQTDAGELLGTSVWELFPETVGARFEKECRRAVETNESVAFEEYYAPLDEWFEVKVFPSESGLSFYFQEISERKARERDLEGYESVVETVEDGIYVTDADQYLQLVNEAYCELVGRSREELLGAHIETVVGEDVLERAARIRDEQSPGETGCIEFDLAAATGETHTVETRYTLWTDDDGAFAGSVGVLRDVTEHREREHELEEYETIVETMDEGVYIVDEDGEFVFVNEAYCKQTGYDREALLSSHVSLVASKETIERAADLRNEFDVRDRQSLRLEADLVRPTGETIRTEATFAFLERPDGDCRIGVVRDVTERKEHERKLDRQRRQLTALNHLHEVISDITEAVIEQSTREEIEATVCEQLAVADSYAFAWIGEANARTETIRLRTEAGVEGYFDDLDPTIDQADPRSDGPAVRALRTRELQVVTDVREEFPFEEWRETAREFDYRSLAAIPITHDSALYGVLCVYAPLPDAFADVKRDVLDRLGEIVGHAIAAVESKRALTSDQVHEIDFEIPNLFAEMDLVMTTDDRIVLDQAVPISEREWLLYGNAISDDIEILEAMLDSSPTWEALRIFGETAGRISFELRLQESPILTLIVDQGGYVKNAWIDCTDYHMTVQLPYSKDARRFTDAILDAFPMTEIRAQRQVARADVEQPRSRGLLDELTDRQRTILRTAYFANYFEWPRGSSGEDVSTSLDISSVTFSQHLRVAQQKIFKAAFDTRV